MLCDKIAQTLLISLSPPYQGGDKEGVIFYGLSRAFGEKHTPPRLPL